MTAVYSYQRTYTVYSYSHELTMALIRKKKITIEKSSGNVFADLGLANPDRELLRAHRKLTSARFRRIALSLPGAVEGSHFGNADFRVHNRIFATLALESEGYGVLLLTPEQQSGMVEDAPEIFSPVPGGWGRQGATRVLLSKIRADMLEAVLRLAWQRRATQKPARPKRKPKT